jgi:hypothetical protein
MKRKWHNSMIRSIRKWWNPISVIVVFKESPAKVVVLEAEIQGKRLSVSEVKQNVDQSHNQFKEKLTELFKEKNKQKN